MAFDNTWISTSFYTIGEFGLRIPEAKMPQNTVTLQFARKVVKDL